MLLSLAAVFRRWSSTGFSGATPVGVKREFGLSAGRLLLRKHPHK